MYNMSHYFLDRWYLKMYTANEYYVYQEGFVKILRNLKELRLLGHTVEYPALNKCFFSGSNILEPKIFMFTF